MTVAQASAVFALEKITDLWAELRPLLEAHYHEIAHFKDIPLDPNVDDYATAEANGRYRFYTARVDGELVGYVGFLCGPALHYRNSLQAGEDVIFVRPDMRKSGLGSGLLRFAHADLKACGIEVVWHHVKKAHPELGRLLEHDGFELVDLMYARRL